MVFPPVKWPKTAVFLKKTLYFYIFLFCNTCDYRVYYKKGSNKHLLRNTPDKLQATKQANFITYLPSLYALLVVVEHTTVNRSLLFMSFVD